AFCVVGGRLQNSQAGSQQADGRMKTTYLLIVMNALIFAAMVGVAGTSELGGFSPGTLIQFGASTRSLVEAGDWWRVFTYMFIHVTPLHLAWNMIALWQAGGELEEHFGRLRYAILYIMAGLGGSAASLVWNWNHLILSAGASGAISGLIGAGV